MSTGFFDNFCGNLFLMSINIPRLSVSAPAKVNLHLSVKDRRPDGFHNLESVFLALDFGDSLHFEPIPGKDSVEIVMEGLNFNLPLEKNIIFKTLSLFRSKTGYDQGLKITVEKRIPVGGGLGGGSSDAAAVLLALNKLAGGSLSRDALLELAASLGSDVPFFIYETASAWVSGRGECIEPIEALRCFFVLVNPGFPSGTAAAFRLLDEYRTEEFNRGGTRSDHVELQNQTQNSVKLRGKKLFSLMETDAFWNDFLPVFKDPEKSVYLDIISQLQKLGADFANLSGAGSTCFGVFKEKAQAEKAAAQLRDTGQWSFVEYCRPRIIDNEH